MTIMKVVPALALVMAFGVHAADDKQEAAEDEVVQCRFERVTGSRTKAYRLCLTKTEWRKRAIREQEELERMREGYVPSLTPTSRAG